MLSDWWVPAGLCLTINILLQQIVCMCCAFTEVKVPAQVSADKFKDGRYGKD